MLSAAPMRGEFDPVTERACRARQVRRTQCLRALPSPSTPTVAPEDHEPLVSFRSLPPSAGSQGPALGSMTKTADIHLKVPERGQSAARRGMNEWTAREDW